MMRGDTLTAGSIDFTGAVHQHLYEYRMRGDLFPAGLRKELSVRIQLEGINLADLALLERDTSFEPGHEVDWLVTRINY